MDDEAAISQTIDGGATLDESTSPEQLEQITDDNTEGTDEAIDNEETTDSQSDDENSDDSEEEVTEDLSPRQTKLVEQIKPLKLNAILERITTPQGKQYTPPNLRDTIDADDETMATIENANSQAYNEGLKQANSVRLHTQIEIDAPVVNSKHKILNPDAEEFNPAVADTLNNMYLNTVQYDPKTDTFNNPTVRYAPFIDAMMELIETAATNKVQESRKNIAQQASNTGIRPNGASPKVYAGDDPSKMTNEQLQAAIARSLK